MAGAGLEWLDQLDAAVGHDLAGRRGDDVDVPETGQIKPRQNTAMSVAPIARPIGDGGVSTISSAAGRKAISSRCRRAGGLGKATTFFAVWIASLADFMDTTLQSVERRVASARPEKLVVGPVFD